MKKKKLVWNAFRYDTNTKQIETFNVIRDDLIEDVYKAKKSGKDIKEAIRTNLMWHYWSKAEHEVLVSNLWKDDEWKKDVWFQLEMNLDRITEYIERELFGEEEKFIKKMRKLDPFIPKKGISLNIVYQHFKICVEEMERLEDIEDDRIQMRAYIDYLKEKGN